jgi:hypothetical protein
MSAWFESGKVRVSDADTKFLRIFRSFLEKYPRIGKHEPEWDAADSVYYALLGMPDVLQNEIDSEERQRLNKKRMQSQAAYMFGRL